jgi:PAS domain S-box-containing protein
VWFATQSPGQTSGGPHADPRRSGRVSLSQLGLENWGRESGLAGRWVRGIVKSEDGFLWIATSGGLSRFDGSGFSNITAETEPALPTNGISAIAARASGGLWLGCDGGGVRVYDAGRLREEPGLDVENLRPGALLEEPAGTLWVGTASGLWRWRDGRLQVVTPASVLAEDAVEIRALRRDRSGGVWVRTAEHAIWRIEEGSVQLVPDPPGCLGVDLATADRGVIVTACASGVWERDTAGAWTEVDSGDYPNGVFVDSTGALWIGASEGLRRRTADTWDLLPAGAGLPDYRVRAFLEDGDGSLWIGSYSGGLARLRRGAVTAIGTPEGLAVDSPTAVLSSRDGSVWIGSAKTGAIRWHPERGVIERLDAARGLPVLRVWAIAEDPAHPRRAWLGTSGGVFALEGRSFRLVDRPEGRTRLDVRLLYADPIQAGTLWVGGTAGGLDEIRADGARRHDPRNGLALTRVSDLRRLRSGRLLAAGEGGLFLLDGERWQPLVHDALEILAARTFVESEDGTLWLASWKHGIVRWRGEAIDRFGEREGLHTNILYSLQLDAEGGLWCSSDEGIARLRTGDFERWVRGDLGAVPVEPLSGREGLRDSECNGWGRPTSTVLANGHLLYPTSRGIAIVDPGRLVEPSLEVSSLYLDRAWAGDRALPIDAPWHLGANERDLRVRFGAIEYLRPEALQFRYLLEGAEKEWNFAGPAREAHYTDIRPGKYRLRLQARLPESEWVEFPRNVELVVTPLPWQATWFRLLMVGLVIALTASVLRWRIEVEKIHAADLAKERAFLRQVIDTSPHPLFVRDGSGTYTLANRAAAAMYGVEPADLEGRTPDGLTRLPGMARIESLDNDVLNSGDDRCLPEVRVVDAFGLERWYRVVKRPGLGPGERGKHVIGSAVDVSDFMRADAALRRERNELLLSRERARMLARQLIRAQEDERSRVARELHDDFTQRLAGLAMLAGSAARGADAGRFDLSERLAEMQTELEHMAREAQQISRRLHPPALEELGLEGALRVECDTFGGRAGMAISFSSQGELDEPTPEVALALFRIVQEALRNCLAHAGTADVRVLLEGTGSALILKIADAGVGFDPEMARSGAGIGLSSMKERARLIDAQLEISSAPGCGTTVTVTVPLDNGAV